MSTKSPQLFVWLYRPERSIALHTKGAPAQLENKFLTWLVMLPDMLWINSHLYNHIWRANVTPRNITSNQLVPHHTEHTLPSITWTNISTKARKVVSKWRHTLERKADTQRWSGFPQQADNKINSAPELQDHAGMGIATFTDGNNMESTVTHLWRCTPHYLPFTLDSHSFVVKQPTLQDQDPRFWSLGSGITVICMIMLRVSCVQQTQRVQR